jgi:hypothetical protein
MPSFASGGQGALFKKTAREASGPLQKFFIRLRHGKIIRNNSPGTFLNFKKII